MEALLKVAPNLTIKVEGENHVAVFGSMAKAQEVFDTSECGVCKGTHIRYVVRENGKNKYYELHCMNTNCRARLPFGVSQVNAGELYPKKRFGSLGPKEKIKRKDEEAHSKQNGGFLPNMGWFKYKKGEEPTDD